MSIAEDEMRVSRSEWIANWWDGDTGFDLGSLRCWHGCLFEFANAIHVTPNAKAGRINYCFCKEVLIEVISKDKV